MAVARHFVHTESDSHAMFVEGHLRLRRSDQPSRRVAYKVDTFGSRRPAGQQRFYLIKPIRSSKACLSMTSAASRLVKVAASA